MDIDRRSLLYAFGIASLTPLISGQSPPRKVAVAKPGESRYKFTHQEFAPLCMVTAQDSGGIISMFEFIIRPKSGPPLHVHHREDETYYVLAGEILFQVGDTKYNLTPGSTIYGPRDVPHCWANSGSTESRMVMACTPGGFEECFEELANATANKANQMQMSQILAKYGCDMLGPPLYS